MAFIQEQMLEALFNNAAIGIITTNKTGEIVLANDFALDKFGYTREEMIGQKVETLIPTGIEKPWIVQFAVPVEAKVAISVQVVPLVLPCSLVTAEPPL